MFVVFYSVCSIYGALALYVWHLGLVSPLYVSTCSAWVGACRFGVYGLRLLPAMSPFSLSLAFSSEVPLAWCGGSWLEGTGLPAMGA